MHVGVIFPQTEIGNDPGAIKDYAQVAEQLGFRHILAYDHVIGANPATRPGWRPPYTYLDPCHEPLVLFGYLSGLTKQVELVSGVLIIGPPGTSPLVERRRQSLLDYAAAQFAALIDDPAVGPEAQTRLGYLHFRSGQYEQTLASARAAADASKDPDIRYLAMFLAAQAAQALGNLASAETWYERALEARPDSQSASLGLASLLYVRGEANRAYDFIDATRTRRNDDDDPWRMFQYGDFPRLPGLIAELRKRVTP